ncbi:gamma-tubulin complex component 3-like [Panonychus citri]|uniref:gamma-tubulin complex component 3-like n=1 Tax=Panonychus citri TaxID=50023 RepID=UPI0023082C7A|nr:gamma-tubulin complex component 3-like [Panonychus citri]
MSDNRVENALEIPSLVHRLCSKLLPCNSDKVSTIYSTTMSLIYNENQNMNLDDIEELYFIMRIKRLLVRNNKESDALRFEELYYKLKRVGTCRNPIAMVVFLYEMSTLNKNKDEKLDLHGQDIASMSNRFGGTSNMAFNNIPGMMLNGMNGDNHRQHSPIVPMAPDIMPIMDGGNNLPGHHNQASGGGYLRNRTNNVKAQRPFSLQIDDKDTGKIYSEIDLFREILFAFQGLNGRILVQDPANDGRYKINPQYNIGICERQMVHRLTNIGWLFNKVNKYCEHTIKNETLGYVCQSFASALHEEVLKFYRLVTIIEQELHFSAMDPDSAAGLTLLGLHARTYPTACLLKVLTNLIENCRNKRGGALIKEVHKYNQHGDQTVRSCMTQILRQVVLPIRQMLSQWIFHGEIDDPYKEFFIIASRPTSESQDPMWHEKYQLNRSMFPGFIDLEQGKKILATGKAVNLLKQVFEDTSCVPGYDILRRTFESTEVGLLFNDNRRNGQEGEFQKLLTRAYHETSKRALELLFDSYHFMDHLKGLRKFMLLGQGDFIRHLMDLSVKKLEEPAQNLKPLELKSLLNTAIRATNAQFLDEDVTERVDVRFSDSLQETGWDIFMLDYRTSGPIKIILNSQIMQNYRSLFKYLWRSKRMEYVLVSLWKQQIIHARSAKIIPKLRPVFHISQILHAEMMHFIQQMQYYIEFEVMECSWDELIRKMEKASDIDQLIEAQEKFLSTVISRSMLDAESQSLSEQLRAIYDMIIQFQGVEENLFKAIDNEISERSHFEKQRRLTQENLELTIRKDSERRKTFEYHKIPDFKLKIQLLGKTYESMVQKFLLLLAVHQDADLRFLSFRLDFNEHYARRNPHLETSFTYSKHRSSLDSSIIQLRSV